MRTLAFIGLSAWFVEYALGACTGMSSADSGICPASQCTSLVNDFSNNATFASYGVSQTTNTQFVSELSPDYASLTSDGLTLSLVKSGTGYQGSTVYFTDWVQYGTITVQIRSGSTTSGVVSSLQLQDESGTSIDMDWIGSSPNSVQANYYIENQLELSQATASSLTNSPTSSFITYKIVWLPDSLTWYANGFAIRTVNRKDTWAEGEQKYKYPSNASRLSFSIWNAADSSNSAMTQQWAGSIPSASTETQFSMAVGRVQIDCYSNTTDSADSSQRSTASNSSSMPAESASEVDLSNFGLSSQNSSPSSISTSPSGGNDLSRWLAEQNMSLGARQLDASIGELLQSSNEFTSDAGSKEPNNEYAGFNLDNILDLMAGDESGNVDFGAIGFELANNLANVVDMNEVGSFATTIGLMMSGIGTAAEIQRQRGGALDLAAQQNNVMSNPVLSSGISALIGQVLAAQQAGSSDGFDYNAANNAMKLDSLDMANLLESVTRGRESSVDVDIHNIANVVDSLLGDMPMHNSKANARAGSSKKATNVPGLTDSISSRADGKPVPRNAASALNDFINGNDTSNISDIAQAIGIRNFFKAEEKVIPD
ncbi:putative glycosidase CRH2, partial [Coemansia sp. RSA 2559]